jgi:hypothetical protein
MGLSRRAQEWLRRDQARRAAERQAAEQAAQEAAERYHAEWLDRQRAADFLGMSTHRLKRLMAAGTGPSCVKNGNTRQATVRWHVDELRAWAADPRAYIAARAAKEGVDTPRHPTDEDETVPDRR